jgi:ribosomal protein S27E
MGADWRVAVTEQTVIRIMCPNLACQRILAIPSHARGKLVRCQGCGSTIRIPQKAAEKPTEQPEHAEEQADS